LSFNFFEIKKNCLSITFIDVGQGDATLITAPGGLDILVDSGRGFGILSGLRTYMNRGDKKIEVAIATHTDSDHVDGFASVLKDYSVDLLLIDDESEEGKAIAEMFEADGTRIIKAEAGVLLSVGDSVSLEILYPHRDIGNKMSTNGRSVVTLLKTPKENILLTGDAPLSVERYVATVYGSKLKSTILKLGHHGSRTSSAGDFLELVKPTTAIISAGKSNSYGHPHPDVISQLKKLGIDTRSTATEGSVGYCLPLE